MASKAWHREEHDLEPDPSRAGHRPAAPSTIGPGYLVLVARELTGLSQRRLAARAGTSQSTIAKIESGTRIPTVRSMLHIANAAGYELVLGLREPDADPPLEDELEELALLGVLRTDPEDGLADFLSLKEPSVFEGAEPAKNLPE